MCAGSVSERQEENKKQMDPNTEMMIINDDVIGIMATNYKQQVYHCESTILFVKHIDTNNAPGDQDHIIIWFKKSHMMLLNSHDGVIYC